MKNTDALMKRLNAVELESRSVDVTFRLEYTNRAVAFAQILTSKLIQAPDCWEMAFGRGNELPPASDGQKLKWLRQYTPEQIDAIRQEWATSIYERNKAALKELDRLLR